MTQTRLDPLSDGQWPQALSDMLVGFAGKLNVYRVMAHHPPLLRAWETLRNHVVLNSVLTAHQSEIVILRAGHRQQSRYEWVQHVVRAKEAGLSVERIAQTAMDSAAIGDGNDDALLIHAVDALFDHGRLDVGLLNSLTARLGTPAVLDIMATVGMYSTLAFLLRTFDVPIEPEIAVRYEAIGLGIP